MRRSSSRGKRCNGRNRLLVQRRQRPMLGGPSFPVRRRNLGFATAPVGRAQRRYPGRVFKWKFLGDISNNLAPLEVFPCRIADGQLWISLG
jgi:hypothetical protein